MPNFVNIYSYIIEITSVGHTYSLFAVFGEVGIRGEIEQRFYSFFWLMLFLFVFVCESYTFIFIFDLV
jgi:hypothetical protein